METASVVSKDLILCSGLAVDIHFLLWLPAHVRQVQPGYQILAGQIIIGVVEFGETQVIMDQPADGEWRSTRSGSRRLTASGCAPVQRSYRCSRCRNQRVHEAALQTHGCEIESEAVDMQNGRYQRSISCLLGYLV